MGHWIVAPIVLPAIVAALLLLAARSGLAVQRVLGLAASGALVVIAVGLVMVADTGHQEVYRLGNWPAPFGIVLVLDRLSALMLLLTAVVAFACLVYAVQGWDARGRNFHALYQFQLMGLNGAFLTGDLFNLFVFFEVLLIASYGLLLHGGGAARLRAGLHYVVINLAASALFLIGVALLYGVTGTLNMADLALKVAAVPPADGGLLRASALILLVVFGVKAALLPLHFWLPAAYGAAAAPVAALFAIMTKVGAYSIMRVYPLVFGPGAGEAASVAADWLLPAALATLAVGAVGALAARDLRTQVAFLVVTSVGTLLTGLGLFTEASLAAAVYYLVHSTVVAAGLFLLVELIGERRGAIADRLVPAAPMVQAGLLGGLFFLGAVAIVGLPPLSGFLGKLFILQSAGRGWATAWVWTVVLATGLIALIGVARAGSVVFWKTAGAPSQAKPVAFGRLAPAATLLGLTALLAVLAGPVSSYAGATAAQIMSPAGYVETVLGAGASVSAGGRN